MTVKSRSFFLLLMWLSITLIACSTQWQDLTETVAPTSTVQASLFTEIDCANLQIIPAEGYTCGMVQVPADHFNPGTMAQLSIPVLIMKADVEEPESDAILYLVNGPGGAILQSASTLKMAVFGSGVQPRDIVWMEPRGQILNSAELNCWQDLGRFQQSTFVEPLTSDAYADSFFTTLKNCVNRAQKNGIDLSHFTVEQDAADVAAVAKALGYEQINLYGFGYGGRVALETLRDSATADLVRSIVLVSPQVAGVNPLRSNLAFHTQLEHLFDTCTNDDACNTAFPNLRTRFYNTLSKLRDEPVPVEAAYQDGIVVLADDTVLLNYVFGELRIGALSVAELPMRLDSILNGDYSPLGEGVYFFRYDKAWGIYVANLCQGDLATPLADEIIQQMRDLPESLQDFFLRRPTFSSRILELCHNFDLPQHTVQITEPVQSNVPTLILTGDFDPVILPEWSEQATSKLSNRLFIIVSEGGHAEPLLLRCNTQAVLRFIDNPIMNTAEVCMQQPVEFYVPTEISLLTTRVPVTIKKLGIATEAPQLIADDLADSGNYNGLTDSGFALEIKMLPQQSLQEAVDQLVDRSHSRSTLHSMTLADKSWQILETPMNSFTMLFAVTQLETGVVYQVEVITEAFHLERIGLTLEQVKESIFLPMLGHFHLIDE